MGGEQAAGAPPSPKDFFACDYFALFGLSPRMEIDGEALRAQYRRLQAAAHPDRFAGAGGAERRAAMLMASRINEAFAALKNPLSRAAHILQLRGVEAFAEDNTAMPPSFLMRQIEWREQLEELQETDARNLLLAEIGAERDAAQKDAAAFLQKDDLPAATDAVRRWKYLQKMLDENAPPP